MPVHVLFGKAARRASYEFGLRAARFRDATRSAYTTSLPFSERTLKRYIELDAALLQTHLNADHIRTVTDNYLAGRFDLLGSGWVSVRHGVNAQGLEGHRYEMSSPVHPDPEGRWLEGRINGSNLSRAKQVWSLVEPSYVPLDWQCDFKVGYRWSELDYALLVTTGPHPGCDIKVPWELARLQHGAHLAWAYGLAASGVDGFAEPERYVAEFRNQVLDFIATNPPRYGAAWKCTMDVGIRAANWALTYDLFRALSVTFDAEFEDVLIHSLFDHGVHIVNHLEWYPQITSNHYLSDIIGLLYIAAYLPRSRETDAWLAFSVQELITEMEKQFYEDGSNFEGSTSYHRLSAELMIYGTALVLGLPDDKREALTDYDHRVHKHRPPLKPAPLPTYETSAGTGVFPRWYLDRLEKMVEFTMNIARPDGFAVQFGDNDSGRLFKLDPSYTAMSAAETRQAFRNLDGYTELPDDAPYVAENILDHRHTASAAGGLFPRDDFAAFSGERRLEQTIVRSLSGNTELPAQSLADQTADGIQLHAYYDFGLYIYRGTRFHLVVRCGDIGQNGIGGHAHNDQTSFELSVDGVPFVVDPGTYVYTSLRQRRNEFRSTGAHNVLRLGDEEQNTWPESTLGTFQLNDEAGQRVLTVQPDVFEAEHHGFGTTTRRRMDISEDGFNIADTCDASGGKTISLLLHPDVDATLEDESTALLIHGTASVRIVAESESWTLEDAEYSPGYGLLQNTQRLVIKTDIKQISWQTVW